MLNNVFAKSENCSSLRRHVCLLLVILFIKYIKVESARILAVFPTPSISHQVVFRPLTQELVKRGHEVVVITTDLAFERGQAPANLTEIDVHDISYNNWKKVVDSVDGSTTNILDTITIAINLVAKIFEELMKSKEVEEIVLKENTKFDLLLVEACVRTTLGLSHIFKVPVIQVSSFGSVVGNYDFVGAPSHPFLFPIIFRDRYYNLTMTEKLTQLLIEIQYKRILKSTELEENEIIRRLFGPKTPPLSDLYNNIEMLFLNVHPIWEDNRPVPPNVVYMGGLHQNSEKPLPKELQTYLDSSKNGVIYVSFGTNVEPSSFPLEKINVMRKVFSRLPYDILLKWDKDEISGWSKNIKISKWFLQSDLLRHQNIKLFITQGGLQSTDEAITAGVPLIGIPMLVDQWYNVEKYVHHKIGRRLDMQTLSEENLENAIKSIIEDESYHQNVQRLRKIMLDQPQTPLERAVWWIEYVLRHGSARHLRPPSANMSWEDYFEFKLVLVLAAFCILTLAVLYIIIKYVCTFIYVKFVTGTKLKIS